MVKKEVLQVVESYFLTNFAKYSVYIVRHTNTIDCNLTEIEKTTEQ